MLETIRKYAHNPIFKIIFGLLVLSFAISGISSMSFSGKEDYVAKVGEKRITQADVEERYRQMLISYGPDVLQMKDEQLRALGISRDNVLKSLIQSALISEEVKDIGIAIGEESIKNQVSKMPVFADDKGKFSAEKFKLFLEKMQISEGRFTADMKTDIQNLILASAVMNNTPKNIFVARQIAGAVKVRRDLDLIEIPADHVKISTNPSDDELGKFYFENSFKYQTPETRDISLVNIAKPAAEDKAGFDKITKIGDELAGGANLTELAAKFALSVEKKAAISKDASKLSNAAFKLEKGRASGLLEDEKGGYFIVQVDDVHERTLPELATVKQKVLADWVVKKKQDENIKFSQTVLADLKDGNKDFAKYAIEKGLGYKKLLEFSSDNKVYGDEFVMAAFTTSSGEVTPAVSDGKGGYLIAKVSSVNQQEVTAEETQKALMQGGQIFQQELMRQYMEYLEKRHPIKFQQQDNQPQGKAKNANPA